MLDAAGRSVDKLADKIDERVLSEFFMRGQVILIGAPGLRRQTRPSCKMNMPNLWKGYRRQQLTRTPS
jgi:hypothetical protein